MMKQKENLYEALTSILLGYLLLALDINLGPINILPDWAGYLLMLSALPALAAEEPSAALLQRLGQGLAVWSGIQWVLKIVGGSLDVYGLGLIVSAVSLYFHFQLLTDVMIAAKNHDLSQAKQMGFLRNLRTVVLTLVALPVDWAEGRWIGIAGALVLLGALVHVAICLELHHMRKELAEKEPLSEGR